MVRYLISAQTGVLADTSIFGGIGSICPYCYQYRNSCRNGGKRGNDNQQRVSGWNGGIEPGAAAPRTQPLYMGRLLYQLSYQGMPSFDPAHRFLPGRVFLHLVEITVKAHRFEFMNKSIQNKATLTCFLNLFFTLNVGLVLSPLVYKSIVNTNRAAVNVTFWHSKLPLRFF